MNDVPDIDLANAGNAVDWRDELRVAELHLRRLDQGIVPFDGVLKLGDLRLLGVGQLLRRPSLV